MRGAQDQMLQGYASPVVAFVHHVHAARDWTVCHLIDQAVNAIGALGGFENAIAVRTDRAVPFGTSVQLVHDGAKCDAALHRAKARAVLIDCENGPATEAFTHAYILVGNGAVRLAKQMKDG